MNGLAKKLLITGGLLAALILIFAYAPISSLARPGMDDRSVEPAERTAHFFSNISTSDGLKRPFPAKRVRADNPSSPEKIELGRLLYFDPVLSRDNDISCAHCHHPDLGFSDNVGLSIGIGGKGLGKARSGGAILRRGSPTVWNAVYNHRQFWDGRAADLEEQALQPIQDPTEMGQDLESLIKELRDIPEYVEKFNRAFPEEGAAAITEKNLSYAIAVFEQTLISDQSRFDQYAAGDAKALNHEEVAGLNLFRSLKTRCFECHGMPTFANPDFKVIGVPDLPGMEADMGHGEFAGEGYNRAFKVPTLRNVALTAPYMHNGIFNTLEEVIDFYAGGGGSGRGLHLSNLDDKIRAFSLSPKEKRALVAFLHSLSDESAKPAIPASVPSGLAVVPPLKNQSTELASFVPAKQVERPKPERRGNTLIIQNGDRIQDGLNHAEAGDTVLVMPGIYHETLTLDKSGITLLGKGTNDNRPILDGKNILSDGLIGSGSDFEIRQFIVRNYTANALMLDGAKNVTFRDVHCDNPGLYGVYPVGCIGVTVERCSVAGARDAGIYVGQSRDIVVRDSRAYLNVTGIEIENSINALVENNEVYNNTGGILVFLLPNNPSKVSSNCRVVNNRIHENNHPNFGDPTAIVSKVPPGTGIMILGADSVEVTGNTISENNSFGIAMIHLDMVYEPGTIYDVDPSPDNNWIHGNTYIENGKEPAGLIIESGFDGRDLLWDLSGVNNSWDEPNANRLPYALPGKSWSEFRRRLNWRTWATLMQI